MPAKSIGRVELAPASHVKTLAHDLDKMHRTAGFGDCKTPGELTAAHLSLMVGL